MSSSRKMNPLGMAFPGLLAGWVGFERDMGATRTLAAENVYFFRNVN